MIYEVPGGPVLFPCLLVLSHLQGTSFLSKLSLVLSLTLCPWSSSWSWDTEPRHFSGRPSASDPATVRPGDSTKGQADSLEKCSRRFPTKPHVKSGRAAVQIKMMWTKGVDSTN